MGAAEPPSALREKAAGPGRSLFAKFCEAILGQFFEIRNPGPFSEPPIGRVKGTGPGIRAHSGAGFCLFVAGGGGELKFPAPQNAGLGGLAVVQFLARERAARHHGGQHQPGRDVHKT